MEPQRGYKRQSLLLIFSWRKLNNWVNTSKWYQANNLLTTYSPSGTATKQRWTISINKLTNSFLPPDQISDNAISFLYTVVFRGERFESESILDNKIYYKPTDTFQYPHTWTHATPMTASLKVKQWDCVGLTLWKQHFKRALGSSSNAWERVAILKIS